MNRCDGQKPLPVYDEGMSLKRLLVPTAFLCVAAAPPVTFIPASHALRPASDEYRTLWQTDGQAMVTALERVTGLSFPTGRIDVIVSEGRPMTTYDGRTIRLRA